MRKAIVVLLALVFVVQMGGVVFAGEEEGCKCCPGDVVGRPCGTMDHPRGKRRDNRLERLSADLNLTPEQKEKVSAVMKECGDKVKAERRKSREAVGAIQNETDTRISAVLTADQAQKYEKMQADRREKTGKRKGSSRENE